ncbi:MAG TPA: hypothetical protein VJ762_04270 [Sphingobium sp.]|nr:hypothetical protein [Sphingobium sp.]
MDVFSIERRPAISVSQIGENIGRMKAETACVAKGRGIRGSSGKVMDFSHEFAKMMEFASQIR